MASKLTQLSSPDVDNLVSVLYGEESLGDSDARAATSCFVEGGLDHLKNIY